jgi:hypothetical protein
VTATGPRPVTRADVEAKLEQIRQVTEHTAEEATTGNRGALIAGGIVVVLLVYLFGRRRGRRTSTVVEVRRI